MKVVKTRTIATDNCKKERVTDGADAATAVDAKPSRTIKPGDIVHVKKPPVTWSFRVKAVTGNRLGAKLVPDYMENVTPQSQLDLLDVVKINGFIDRHKGLGRPTKKEGRELSRFTDMIDGTLPYEYDDESMGWDLDFDD